MDSVLATLKVNNEIELCQVEGQEAKKTMRENCYIIGFLIICNGLRLLFLTGRRTAVLSV